MYAKKENCFYYITIENENYQHPEMPKGVEEGIINGMYLLEPSTGNNKHTVQLFGSGAILREVRAAAAMLLAEYQVDADVWSMTSINELRRDGLACERWNLLNPDEAPRTPYVATQLEGHEGPVVCATDYMKAYGEQILPFIGRSYRVLGTDGYGRSATRSRQRYHFEVDRYFVVIAALTSLSDEGKVDRSVLSAALKKYGIDNNKPDPISC
jgi:pyruvate dehydrogenase E1 component